VTALLLSAVDSTRWESCVALPANHLVDVVRPCEKLERRLNDSSSESQDEVKSGLFLNVVVRESSTILELFPGEDESLLIGGDSLLILNLLLNILDGVRGFDLKGDGLSSESFDEDLHC